MLPSIGNEIVKAVVAQYNAEQLLTQRDKVSRAVRSPRLPARPDCSRLHIAGFGSLSDELTPLTLCRCGTA